MFKHFHMHYASLIIIIIILLILLCYGKFETVQYRIFIIVIAIIIRGRLGFIRGVVLRAFLMILMSVQTFFGRVRAFRGSKFEVSPTITLLGKSPDRAQPLGIGLRLFSAGQSEMCPSHIIPSTLHARSVQQQVYSFRVVRYGTENIY